MTFVWQDSAFRRSDRSYRSMHVLSGFMQYAIQHSATPDDLRTNLTVLDDLAPRAYANFEAPWFLEENRSYCWQEYNRVMRTIRPAKQAMKYV